MKTVYIPKGETVHYESLTTEHLVVHGRLHVTYGVKAQSITGSGVIDASSINADTVCIDDVESGTVICKRLTAKRVQAPEVFASESAAVSCFLSAAYVETGKLTAAISEVDEVVAQEVVNLTPKKRTLFGTLFASMLRSFWTALTAPGQKAEVLDAEFVPAQEDHTETVQNEGSAEFSASDQSVPEVEEKQEDVVDEELNRIVGLFKLSREQGYTLKLIPGTPEENAPAANPQPKQGNSQPTPASAPQRADRPTTRSDSQQTQPVQQSRAAASRTVPFTPPQSAARQRTDCYVVLSTKVQGGMSGSSTLVTLRAPDGKQIPAFARGARPELSAGTVLSNVKITMRQQDTVAFYVLESYEIVPQEDRAA